MSKVVRRLRPDQVGRANNDPLRSIDKLAIKKALLTLFECCKAYGYDAQGVYESARRAYPTVPTDFIEQMIYGLGVHEWTKETPSLPEKVESRISRSRIVARRNRNAK